MNEAKTGPGSREWAHKLILVVDDDQFMRYSLSRYLTAKGFQVKTTKDGFEVLLQCLELKPDLIVSDIRMPKLDGVSLLKGLRNRVETSDIPVIFMSAYATDEAMEEARKLGAEFFLIKPFSNQQLEALIGNIFRRREKRSRVAGTEWNDGT